MGVDASGDPSTSPNNQWANLNDFVTRAENYGLFVELHFASGWLLNNIGARPPSSVASQYASSVGKFIQYLNSTNAHRNVLLWGMAYAFVPAVSDPTGTWSTTWQQVYYDVDQQARLYSPWPGVVGLVGTDLDFTNPSGVILRNSGYFRLAGFAAAGLHDAITADERVRLHEGSRRLSDANLSGNFIRHVFCVVEPDE